MAVNTVFPTQSTNTGSSLFAGATASGLVQGTAYPDPATTWSLRTGLLATTETLPMWGGLPIYENVPGVGGGPRAPLGPIVGRATTWTGGSYPTAGFSVFDQAYGMVIQPGQSVPLAGSGMQVMSHRLGSGARIAVACDAALVNLRGGSIGANVAWDFVNGMLVPYTGAIAVSSGTYASTLSVSSGTYNPQTGLVTLTLSAASGLNPFGSVVISGATGTGSFASINGTQVLVSASGTTISYTIATGLTMTITGGTVASGTVTLTMASAPGVSQGDSVVVSAATGTGSFASINGTYSAGAGTTGTTVVYSIATGLTLTITGGSLTTGSALVGVEVLDVVAANCLTVVYTGGQATWNYNGSAAVIQI